MNPDGAEKKGTVQVLDPVSAPLSGTVLIEASAGTGKTYTIASLFVRLITETRLTVDRILVVTFTEAATAELRDRIRKRLAEAVLVLENRMEPDPVLAGIREKTEDRKEAIERLQSAIRSFDRAAIFTIHGFCHRMLRENSFESGLRFDTDLVEDPALLLQNAADDVWRTRFHAAPEQEAAYLLSGGFSPERLAALAGRHTAPGLCFLPEEASPLWEAAAEDLHKAASAAKTIWEADKAEIIPLLSDHPGLNRNKLRKTSLAAWFQELDAWCKMATDLPFEKFDRFTPHYLAGATKKGFDTPEHRFFPACEQVLCAAEDLAGELAVARAVFRKEMIQAVLQRQEVLKEQSGSVSFDDLLIKLSDAVERDDTSGMTGRIRELFGAALMDEFQDTDPVQYRIFDRVFGQAHLPLFLIGDPKQAIYAFRGADVFAYLKAARKTDHRFTLGHNWRSDPGMIAAVNQVFSKNTHAFLIPEIPFLPVAPAPKEGEILHDPDLSAAFCVWQVRGDGEKPAGAIQTRKAVTWVMADEIVRLVTGGREDRIRIGEKPVSQGDIAILVRTNQQAVEVKEALLCRGIASVIQSDGNVFDTEEAVSLQILMAAIARPGDEGRIRRALATRLMGYGAGDLDAANRDAALWHPILEAFRNAHETWMAFGVMRMLRAFYDDAGILTRMVRLSGGERRVTNLLHLAELLHGAETGGRGGIQSLLQWMEAQMDPASPRRLEAPMRLESDGDRVRIVTIHKSKGLEYPVVFCPFSFGGVDVLNPLKNPDGILSFHDPDNDMQLTVDLGGPDREKAAELATTEALSEDVRLLYVALTRAKHRCYFAWGEIRNADTSATAWLLHGKDPSDLPGPFSMKEMVSDLAFLSECNGICVSPLPEEKGRVLSGTTTSETERIRCKARLPRPASFRVTSFSGIVSSSRLEEAEVPEDRDSLPAAPVRTQEVTPEGIFSFPAGARAGTFLHEIFEHLDFTAPRDEIASLVTEKLTKNVFAETWEGVITDMVERVLAAPLGPDGIRLSSVALADRINEMEFYFPLQPVLPEDLSAMVREITEDACRVIPEQLDRMTFRPVSGYLHGFMDLMFRAEGRYYLVDWKSNLLGLKAEDYTRARMEEEMAHHLYTLQYYLYAIAMDRYLALRIPDYDYERDFGGVGYLFLRGVEAGKDTGIFFERPDKDRIRRLSELLIAPPGTGENVTGS